MNTHTYTLAYKHYMYSTHTTQRMHIINVTVSGKTCHVANFMKFWLAVYLISSTSPPSLRPITRFALEVERFVCDRATHMINEKLRSKDIAMHAYSVSVYYA